MSTLSLQRLGRPAARSLFHRFDLAFAVWRQRRCLARLDAAARRDLGLSEAEIQRELDRPIWPLLF